MINGISHQGNTNYNHEISPIRTAKIKNTDNTKYWLESGKIRPLSAGRNVK